MKKVGIVLVATLVAGIATADLAVLFKNNAGTVTEIGSGGAAGVDQILVQLIWSSSAPSAQATDDAGTDYLGTGEFLLSSLVTVSGNWGTWVAPASPDQYDDLSVGGNAGEDTTILAGHFFVRMFDASALGENDYYLQQAVTGPGLTQYDSGQASSIYDTNGLLGGSDIDSQGHQVIPEPAVASLIAIFGGGLIFLRRIFTI